MFRQPALARTCIEIGLSLLLLVAFLSVRDLPLVDLPQHALQIQNWLRLDAHASGVSDLELNFRTPYLLAYPFVRVLAAFVSVLTALKLVFWASITLQAVALRKLCQVLGHDAWLGLLGFPLGLGYSFCFGFVAFCAALPLVYLGFAQLIEHAREPTPKRGAKLALTLALLLVAHGVALGFFMLVASPLLLGGGGKVWQRSWPLAAPPLLGVLWLAPGGQSTRLGGDLWLWEPHRLLQLPAELVSIGVSDPLATPLGLLLLGVVLASLGKRQPLLFWLPLVASLLGYLLFPLLFRGAGPLHPRFASYLVPSLLLTCAPSLRARAIRRGLGVATALGVLLVFWSRLGDFNHETADFHALVADLPAGLNVRPIVFERGSAAFPGIPAHLHLPAYYAVEKGGTAGYSFAMYSISVVRLRPGAKIRMWGGSEWAPESFDATREAGDYDYFIVKSSADRSAALFPGPTPLGALDRHVGAWWGYRRTEPRSELAAAPMTRPR